MVENNSLQGFPLSAQQKRIWLWQKNGAELHARCTLLIEGQLVPERLREALQECINRHEILRTSFQETPMLEFPLQVIHEHQQIEMQEIDLHRQEAPVREQELQQLLLAQHGLPFVLKQGPAVRATLIRLTASQHMLLLEVAALCSDTSTLQALIAELFLLYAASEQNQSALKPPLEYADFAAWQEDMLAQDVPRQAQEFWRQRQGAASLTLPFQIADDTIAAHAPATYNALIKSETVNQVKMFAANAGVSVECVLFACWATLLARVSGVSDLKPGIVAQGREIVDDQTLLGPVARCLPLHIQLDRQMDIHQMLQDVAAALEEARRWEVYCEQAYQPVASSQRGKLHTSISFEYCEWPVYQSAEISFKVHSLQTYTEPFNLKLTCTLEGQVLRVDIQYNPALYTAEGIAQLSQRYHVLLESILAHPTEALSRLNILIHQDSVYIETLNATEKTYQADRYIHQLFEEQVIRTPERQAVVYEDEQLTYAELNTQANQLAHFLQKHGAGIDRPVVLLLDRSPRVITGLLAVLKAGSPFVPMSPERPPLRFIQQIASLHAPVILTQQRYREQLLPYEGSIVCLDSDWGHIATEPVTNPVRPLLVGEQLAYIIYTSGSTGIPKGVMITHRNLLNYVYALQEQLAFHELAEQEYLHFAHVSAFEADLGHTVIFLSLISGGCLHIFSRERTIDSQLFHHTLTRQPIDVLKITPSHLDALLTMQDARAFLPTRYLILGGEALPLVLIKRLQETRCTCAIINHYGPTETTIGSLMYDASTLDLSQNRTATTVSIGRPVGNTEVYILDQELQIVPPGVPGEICIGGAGLARGYISQPDQTAERFIPNPFPRGKYTRLYRTGDIGRILPDGNVEFLGRNDFQIKIRGFRVEPGEVEKAILQHPAIRSAVVTARAVSSNHPQLVAYITPSRGQQSTSIVDDLRNHLKSCLPEHMVPSSIVVLKYLPVTPNGKIDYRSLPAPEPLEAEKRPYVAPRSPSEEIVATLIAQLLDLERVSVDDNFFELGGHSLLATQLVARLHEAFEVELPVRLVFDYPTPAELSMAILEIALQQDDPEEITQLLQEIQQQAPME